MQYIYTWADSETVSKILESGITEPMIDETPNSDTVEIIRETCPPDMPDRSSMITGVLYHTYTDESETLLEIDPEKITGTIYRARTRALDELSLGTEKTQKLGHRYWDSVVEWSGGVDPLGEYEILIEGEIPPESISVVE